MNHLSSFLVCLGVFLTTQSLWAQRSCATMEVLQNQLDKDPTLAHRRDVMHERMNQWISEHPMEKTNVVYTIPVVVHVVYRLTSENISDAQVKSQIDVLNNDFRKTNADASSIPSAFQSIASDTEILFCLASKDPNNNTTTGITRTSTTKTSFSQSSEDVKSASTGGHDPWDTDKYLNIWVCKLGGGLLGYAQFPGGDASTDGVVILNTAFGTTGSATAPYNKGRTTTHEVGHYFDLYHIWGDEPNCSADDNVTDTPLQQDKNFNCPTYPLTDNCQTSSPGVMFMNYMDYVDDNCMYMFTAGQKSRMRSAINNNRAGLKNSTAGCSYTSIEEETLLAQESVLVYPNPAQEMIKIYAEKPLKNSVVSVYDNSGKLLKQIQENYLVSMQLDMSAYSRGIYFIQIRSENGYIAKKLILE